MKKLKQNSPGTHQSFTVVHHEDSGHGWFQVPYPLLVELGIERLISCCSFRSGEIAYLEQEFDANIFFRAWRILGVSVPCQKQADIPNVREVYDGVRSFILDLPRYHADK
jgi:hypothetical protein